MALLMNIRSFSFVNYIGVDDFSDRMSYKITSLILTVLSFIVTTRTYAMKPIACYIPHSFGFEKGGQVDFVDQYCLTEGTYAVKVKDFLLSAEMEDGGLSQYEDRKIYYYQWVPFVLAFQAVLCCLPRLLWRIASFDRAGTDVGRIVKLAQNASEETIGGEGRKKMVTHITRLIARLIKQRKGNKNATQVEDPSGEYDGRAREGGSETKRTMWVGTSAVETSQSVVDDSSCCCSPLNQVHTFCCCAPLKRINRQLKRLLPSQLSGSCLILTYLGIKLAYLLNALVQLHMIQEFLQLNSTAFGVRAGVELLRNVFTKHDWQNSMVFPRVGACAVQMKSSAGANWLFAQCALPVNMINEKICVFLWIWFLLLTCVTAASIVSWIVRLICRCRLERFVKDYLRLADNYKELKQENMKALRKFVAEYVSQDGAFLLKMISLNCGDMICAEIVTNMWESFQRREDATAMLNLGGQGVPAPLAQGLLQLQCQGLPKVECKRRRGILKRQNTAPATSNNPDAEELADYGASVIAKSWSTKPSEA